MDISGPEPNVDAKSSPAGAVQFGPFRLDPARRKLWRDDELITLPPKAFDLLALLIEAAGSLVKKDELMTRLWPETFVSDESLTQCVSALRRALGDDPTHPQFISTIPKRGYRFVAPLTAGAAVGQVPSISAATEQPSAPRDTPRVEPIVPEHRAARTREPQAASIAAAIALVGIVAVFAFRLLGSQGAEARPVLSSMRFLETAPANTLIVSGGALSPDGQSIAYLARNVDSRLVNLWIRGLTGTSARILPGTAGATRPFWAPDSRAIGFFSEGKVRTIDLATGAVQTLANVGPMPVGGSWSSRGVIVFANRRSNLFAVSAAGGTPYPVTTLNRSQQESAHRYPYFLPDGDRFLYYANSADAKRAGTYISSLSGKTPHQLLDASSGGTIYAEPGYLVHISDHQLLAEAFDFSTERRRGTSLLLAGNVEAPQITNQAFVSASSTGVVAYGGGNSAPRLAWFDEKGQRLSSIDAPAELHNPVLSPDGNTLLASSLESERRGTWLVDNGRTAANWLIREGVSPLASPDGKQVLFQSNRGRGITDIYARTIGSGDDKLVFSSNEPKAVNDVTNDGRYLVFTSSNAVTNDDVWFMDVLRPETATPLVRTEYNEMQGEVSPDGHWLAYASDESGRFEVYIQRFPEGGWKRAISTSGGAEPHWRADGRRLFYLAGDQRVMGVSVTPATAQMGRPEPLFVAPLWTDLPTIFRNQYAVSPDGRRFLIDTFEGVVEPITVLVNWIALPQPSVKVTRN